ncbi:hypothetical protein IQ247_09735 [Plectonema cf. radiosum LEGE 06105]|uniref:Uncharacterized protein n=1 Tax=Plectonema cf. radiosum LEGE 06105 TaxID=945769 RepID=A0A8J7K0W8_9CYAN|nr:hypothetical protein [Plectonema radiosum]MBE9212962.1 hypothetical protein [Plectonema cf. radiosum LEGE 06105]
MNNNLTDRKVFSQSQKSSFDIRNLSSQQVQSIYIYSRLTDKDYEEAVTKRGLCPEWVLVNCRSMETSEASERLRIDAKYGGIWLEGVNGFGQFRPRKAFKTSEANKKALKGS